MSILAVLGNRSGGVKQREGRIWTYPTGESMEVVHRGVYQAILNLYDQYRAVAGFVPSIDSLQLTYERGLGTLTVATVEDGPAQYELLSNEVSLPIEYHPYFTTQATALTSSELHAVQVSFQLGYNKNPKQYIDGVLQSAPFDGSAFSAKQAELYAFLAQGVEYYTQTAYVLRESRIVSKRSQVTASYTNVNNVDTPPTTQNVNSLIGALPAGEWLKKAPNVRMYGNRKWQIATEWWWAPKWSKILYNGTGTP